MRALCVLVVLAAGTAHAACPDKRASCVLHEEGVALFLEGKHDLAAAKFAAAIAAEPTARSYLGYAQTMEALGRIALAYDTMVAAQRLSQAEVQQTGGKDVDVGARAERIKYKLGELRAKIGFVWLRVPEGVAPQRVVAVQRQGEGDLSQPLTQWTAVAPGRQVLIASIDDGSKLEVVAEVAAGSQGVVVIPIVASQRNIPVGRPVGGVFMPIPRPVEVPVKTYVTLGGSVVAPGGKSSESDVPTASSGLGFNALYERRLNSSFGLATRLEFLFHGETDGGTFETLPKSVEGNEFIATVGLRTWGSRTIHGRAAVGFSIYSQKTTDTNTGVTLNEFTRLYPGVEFGGGLHLGRLRIEMGLMFTASGDADVTLGTRFMGSLGIDLYRK
ncbi:MAG: hypothetical protein ABI867_06300 [Kofleriaceae bacterium]